MNADILPHMARALAILVSWIWGLWFGGIVLLFVAVQSLFNTFQDRRDVFAEGAAGIFRWFNRYQVALAAAALLATFAWRLVGPPRLKAALFTLFAIATVAACAAGAWIAPKIQSLHAQGLDQSPQFKQVHGLSMAVYLVEAIALLVAGVVLLAAAMSAPSGAVASPTPPTPRE